MVSAQASLLTADVPAQQTLLAGVVDWAGGAPRRDYRCRRARCGWDECMLSCGCGRRPVPTCVNDRAGVPSYERRQKGPPGALLPGAVSESGLHEQPVTPSAKNLAQGSCKPGRLDPVGRPIPPTVTDLILRAEPGVAPSDLDCQATRQRKAGQRMRPLTRPTPSVLPYLSSVEVGWDGLLAEAWYLPMEVERYMLPAETDILIALFTGGELRLEAREVHAQYSWMGVDLHPGDLILSTGANLPYEVRWRSLSSTPTSEFDLRISRDLLVRTAEELAGGDATQLMLREQVGFQDPLLCQIALTLWGELREGAPMGRLFAQSATQMLILQLLRHYASWDKVIGTLETSHRLTPQQLRSVLAYIRDHPSEDLTLEVLAQQAGFSPYHFHRLFQQTTGETPHQRVRRERLEHAQCLLKSTTLSLAEVAAETGFADQSYFTRVFKQALRMTPAAYRRECRN
jgi:AraC family transcriptional regulator